ncbi:MAG: hypothetical protein KTR31_13095 [Myxococcales bacterium]|nr:hypothetical protein [Myxococcales bacterium]
MSHDRNALIEEVVSAWRSRDPHGRVQPSPAWFDLPEEDRRQAFRDTLQQRRLEAASHPQGLSSTARAVLARLEPRSPAPPGSDP